AAFLSGLVPAAAADIAARFAAVTAVVLLPQVGRGAMRTRQTSPWTDTLFLACATPCACLAAAPFVPKLAWAAGWIPYWPLTAAAYVLPSAMLCIRGVRTAGMFTLALLALCAGAAAALYAGIRPDAPLWMRCALEPGMALAAFFLTASASGTQAESAGAAEYDDCDDADEPDVKADLPGDAVRRIREAAEALVGEACRFDQIFGIYAGEEARKRASVHADAMVSAAKRIADAAEGRPSALPDAPAAPAGDSFDIRDIVQKVISDAAVHARAGGTALSWYVAPGLETLFTGDGAVLSEVLPQLMLETVRASRGGAAGIRVEPSPEGFHPGSLRFTVTGSGSEDFGRGGALARACGLIAGFGRDFALESGPSGSRIRFDAELACAPSEAGAPDHSVPVIIAAPDGTSRPLIREYLSGMGLELWEVRTAAEASALRRHVPAGLIVMDGRLAEADMALAIADARSHESEAGLAPVPFLLLSAGEEEGVYLEHAGCDASIPLPPVRRDLRAMVRWLMSPPGTMRRPVLTGERVTLGDVMAGEGGGRTPAGLRRKPESGLAQRGAPGTDAGAAGTDSGSADA
ncbi:MAG: hypothetical protein MJ061_04670, partial [Mailhella sp.]|nr:hypothetical protein [Mailhella sp.]